VSYEEEDTCVRVRDRFTLSHASIPTHTYAHTFVFSNLISEVAVVPERASWHSRAGEKQSSANNSFCRQIFGGFF